MAKNSITDYDKVSANNTDVQSVDISEGCSPSGINNAIREVMADLAAVNDGTVALTSPVASAMSVTTTLTAGGIDINGNEFILDADGDTSITADTDDQIDFKTGGSDRVTINSSGYVGIGTTSPATATGNGLDMHGAGGTSVRLDDTTNTVTGELQVYSSGMNLATVTNDNLILSTNNSERMRIDSSGRMLVGVTGTFYTDAVLQVKQSNTSSGNNACIAVQNMNASGGSGVYTIAFVNSTGGLNGTISNTSSSTSYNTSSDYRLKENDVDMTGAIERVKQLQPKRFNFIADADTTVDGFMAHEVQSVVPEAITGTHNEVDADGNPVYQGIDQSKLVPLLTGALQEAIAKIEALEARVEALETA